MEPSNLSDGLPPRVLDYESDRVRTYAWEFVGDHRNWRTVLTAADGEKIVLSRFSDRRVVEVRRGSDELLLRPRLLRTYVHAPDRPMPIAVLGQSFISGRTSVRFADGRQVRFKFPSKLKLALSDRITVLRGRETLLTVQQNMWPFRGRDVKLQLSASGITFPWRFPLLALAFHSLIIRHLPAPPD